MAETAQAPAGVVCRTCGSNNMICVQHPTGRKQWYVWECEDCGHRGGAHKHHRP